MNLLFVCSENRLRSPTGEEVFSAFEGIYAIGAGTKEGVNKSSRHSGLHSNWRSRHLIEGMPGPVEVR